MLVPPCNLDDGRQHKDLALLTIYALTHHDPATCQQNKTMVCCLLTMLLVHLCVKETLAGAKPAQLGRWHGLK